LFFFPSQKTTENCEIISTHSKSTVSNFLIFRKKISSRDTIPLNVQGSAAASPAAGAGEEAEHGQGPGRIQALLQGEDEALRPGGSTLN
jgi:hypothetical protein